MLFDVGEKWHAAASVAIEPLESRIKTTGGRAALFYCVRETFSLMKMGIKARMCSVVSMRVCVHLNWRMTAAASATMFKSSVSDPQLQSVAEMQKAFRRPTRTTTLIRIVRHAPSHSNSAAISPHPVVFWWARQRTRKRARVLQIDETKRQMAKNVLRVQQQHMDLFKLPRQPDRNEARVEAEKK